MQLNHLAVACVTLRVDPDFLQHAACQCDIWKAECLHQLFSQEAQFKLAALLVS